MISSGYDDRRGFDDVAHEARWIPVRLIGLRDAAAVGAANHQRVFAGGRQGDRSLPLPEAELALVLAKCGRLPALAAVNRQIDTCHAGIAAERNAADQRRGIGLYGLAGFEIRDERSR